MNDLQELRLLSGDECTRQQVIHRLQCSIRSSPSCNLRVDDTRPRLRLVDAALPRRRKARVAAAPKRSSSAAALARRNDAKSAKKSTSALKKSTSAIAVATAKKSNRRGLRNAKEEMKMLAETLNRNQRLKRSGAEPRQCKRAASPSYSGDSSTKRRHIQPAKRGRGKATRGRRANRK